MPWSDEEGFFVSDPVSSSGVLDLMGLPSVQSGRKGSLVRVTSTQPEPEDADALLWRITDKNTQVATDFFRDAKSRLKGRGYDVPLYQGAIEVPAGVDVYPELRRWVASAVSLLFGREGVGPEHIYSLFFKPVEQLPDDEGKDWSRRLWRLVEWAWGRELGNAEDKLVKQEEAHGQAVDALDAIIAGVRGWNPLLPEDPSEALEWIKRRMIAHAGQFHFVMRKDGLYSKNGVTSSELYAQIHLQGMQGFINITRETKEGKIVAAPYVEVAADYMIPVSAVEALPEKEGGYLVPPAEGEVNPRLVIPSYRRRRDLTPQFDARCDELIRALAGFDKNGFSKHEQMNRHLGCMLAFENGPCAAMSIIAPPTAGKGMLVKAFVECLEEPEIATEDDLVGSFNAALAKTPFLSLNEGLPETWHKNALDAFRRLVTADAFSINEKHKPIIKVSNDVRIFITANNMNIFVEFGNGRDLEPHDREALGIRLIHYGPGDAPCRLLKAKGGKRWTKGWIADKKSPSNFVLARHLLWLWELYGKNAEPGEGASGERLLVQGDPDSIPIEVIRTQAGSTPTVIEAFVDMLSPTRLFDASQGFLLDPETWCLCATSSAILNHWRKHLTEGAAERLTLRKVESSLKGLSISDANMTEALQAKYGRQWVPLDLRLIADQAIRYGLRLDQIRKIMDRDPSIKPFDPSARKNGMNGTAGHVPSPVSSLLGVKP